MWNNWDKWCYENEMYILHYSIFKNEIIEDGFSVDICLN